MVETYSTRRPGPAGMIVARISPGEGLSPEEISLHPDRFVLSRTADSSLKPRKIQGEDEKDLRRILAIAGTAIAGAAVVAGACLFLKKADPGIVADGLRGLFAGAARLHLPRIVPQLFKFLGAAAATAAVTLLMRRLILPEEVVSSSEPFSFSRFSRSEGRPLVLTDQLTDKPAGQPLSARSGNLPVKETTRKELRYASDSLQAFAAAFGKKEERDGVHSLPAKSALDAEQKRRLWEPDRLISAGFQPPPDDVEGDDDPIATWLLLPPEELRRTGSSPFLGTPEERDVGAPSRFPVRTEEPFSFVPLPYPERRVATEIPKEERLDSLLSRARGWQLIPMVPRGDAGLPDSLPQIVFPGVAPPTAVWGPLPEPVGFSFGGIALNHRPMNHDILPRKGRTVFADRGSAPALVKSRRRSEIAGLCRFSSFAADPSFNLFFYGVPMTGPRVIHCRLDTAGFRQAGTDYSRQIERVALATEYEIRHEEILEDLPEIPDPDETAEGQERGGDQGGRGEDAEDEELTEVV